MAGAGRIPQATRSRKRDEVQRLQLSPDEVLRGPDLPDGWDWCERTRAWWQTWRRSAQAQTWGETDWDFLADTAVLHNQLWSEGRADVLPELRLRVAKFGATPEDRLRLRLSVEPKGLPMAPAKPARAATARRSRLLKAVDATAG